MEFLEVATWVTIGKIILIDILLAGDNAVVIGMAAGKLATTKIWQSILSKTTKQNLKMVKSLQMI